MHILDIPQTGGHRRATTTSTPTVAPNQPSRTDLPQIPPCLRESVRLAEQESPGPRRDGRPAPAPGRPAPWRGSGRETPIIQADSVLYKTAVENLAKHPDLRAKGRLRCPACDWPSPCPSRETAAEVIVRAGQRILAAFGRQATDLKQS